MFFINFRVFHVFGSSNGLIGVTPTSLTGQRLDLEMNSVFYPRVTEVQEWSSDGVIQWAIVLERCYPQGGY